MEQKFNDFFRNVKKLKLYSIFNVSKKVTKYWQTRNLAKRKTNNFYLGQFIYLVNDKNLASIY